MAQRIVDRTGKKYAGGSNKTTWYFCQTAIDINIFFLPYSILICVLVTPNVGKIPFFHLVFYCYILADVFSAGNECVILNYQRHQSKEQYNEDIVGSNNTR